MSEAFAAHNYIPVWEKVNFPSQGELDATSLDEPFEDGFSGFLSLKIKARSPLLVSGVTTKNGSYNTITPSKLYTLGAEGKAQEQWGFEGSALRGAIRAVLEIATFSKIATINDKAYFRRDFGEPAYRDRMTRTVFTSVYRSKVRAGRLTKENEKWILTPCEYSRVHHFTERYVDSRRKNETSEEFRWTGERDAKALCLMSLVNSAEKFDAFFMRDGGKDFTPWPKSVEQFHQWFQENAKGGPFAPPPKDFAVSFSAGETLEHQHDSKTLVYSLATNLTWLRNSDVPEDKKAGHLVFTAQMGSKRPPFKHMEYVFHQASIDDKPVEVPTKVWDTFCESHGGAGENWTYWKKWYEEKHCTFIPVFWIGDTAGSFEQMGLCQNFRLKSTRTTSGFLPDEHRQSCPDWSDLIFGSIPGSRGRPASPGAAWAHRVQFPPVVCSNPVQVQASKQGYWLANAEPKGFPGFEISQDVSDSCPGKLKDEKKPYTTVLDELAKRRGLRWYPARTPDNPPCAGPKEDQKKHYSQLFPLVGDESNLPAFDCRVNVHNLRPFELGALLWSLTLGDWDGGKGYVHRVGRGKSLGFGQIHITIDWENSNVRGNAGWQSATKETLVGCLNAFVTTMNTFVDSTSTSGFQESDSVKTLLLMSQPEVGDRLATDSITKFAHASLDDFKRFKIDRKVLRSYLQMVNCLTPPAEA